MLRRRGGLQRISAIAGSSVCERGGSGGGIRRGCRCRRRGGLLVLLDSAGRVVTHQRREMLGSETGGGETGGRDRRHAMWQVGYFTCVVEVSVGGIAGDGVEFDVARATDVMGRSLDVLPDFHKDVKSMFK